MIKNIPNKYTVKLLKKELDKNFKDKFDFLYLPHSKEQDCNLGYGFINFTDSLHILLFREMYDGNKWRSFNSSKQCALGYARFQGSELINHLQNSYAFINSDQDKRPFICNLNGKEVKIDVPTVSFFH